MSTGNRWHTSNGLRREIAIQPSFTKRALRARKRQNKVGKIIKEDEGWVESEAERNEFITNHFVQLFQSAGQGDPQQLLEAVPTKVS
jgi:hypothetical protein